MLAAACGSDGLRLFQSEAVDVVLSDVRMPEMDGLDLLARLKAVQPDVPVVRLTAHGTVGPAVEAMKLGAFDYLTKPFSRDQPVRHQRYSRVDWRIAQLAAHHARAVHASRPHRHPGGRRVGERSTHRHETALRGRDRSVVDAQIREVCRQLEPPGVDAKHRRHVHKSGGGAAAGERRPAAVTKLVSASNAVALQATGGEAAAIEAWLTAYDAAFMAKDFDKLATFSHSDVTIYEGGGINDGGLPRPPSRARAEGVRESAVRTHQHQGHGACRRSIGIRDVGVRHQGKDGRSSA